MVTLAMTFAVRGDILSALGVEFDLSHAQQGLIMTAVGVGYPVAILVAGPLVDVVGMRRLLLLAATGHLAGILLTIASPAFGYPALLGATLLIGLADGVVEAVINPLAATLYPDDRTGRITLLHAAWPFGLIVGGLLCVGLSPLFHLGDAAVPAGLLSLSWKVKMATALVPPLLYGWLVWGQPFPQTERVAAGVPARAMFREALRPGFLLLLGCMVFTAATEMGPDEWVGSVMSDTTGVRGILFLVYTSVIMFAMRWHGGAIVRRFTPFGTLAGSCVFAAAGLFWMSHAFHPGTALLAATLFGIGKTLLWPTLLGVTADRFPRAGALLLALLSATGTIAGGAAAPAMGRIYDRYTIAALPASVARVAVVDGRFSPEAAATLTAPADAAAVKDATRQGAAMTYRWAALLPALPFLVYVVLGLRVRAGP